MTMLYLFLALFASQLFLATPMMIGKEQAENKEDSPSLEVKKPLSESGERKTPPFLLLKAEEAPLESSSFQHFQAKYPGARADRKKRDTQPNKVQQEDHGCRKEDFIIHTTDLGFSPKSIRPESFNAYQCKGKCSQTQKKKFVNHSLLTAFVKKKKGIKTDGEACCVPTKLRPMSFIYPEQSGSFMMRTFPDTIVEECGCY